MHKFTKGNFGPTTAPLCSDCGLSKQASTHWTKAQIALNMLQYAHDGMELIAWPTERCRDEALAECGLSEKAETHSAKLLDVAVFVYPDGTTYWMENPTEQKARANIGIWKARNPDLVESGCTMGTVQIRMREHDYLHQIPTTIGHGARRGGLIV